VQDVALASGRIAAMGRKLPKGDADRIIEAEGLIACPGLIDPHVHLREPGGEHKETIATGTHAAVAGGFSAVCCMPNTTPALDSPELVRFVFDRASAAGLARVFPVAAATKGRKGEEPAELMLMAEAGAAAFSDDGDCIPTAGVMARVLSLCASLDRVFMQHCQDPTLTKGASMHAGAIATKLGLTGWPRIAEEIIVERDIRLARGAGARYHVQHISSAETVAMIRAARARGERVTGEASPHHLHLTHEACDGYNTMAKVNPPLREAADVAALRQGVADGTITVLATDHAPHSADEKAQPFEDAPMGLIGLESALPLYAEALVTSGAISWTRLIELMTVTPAALCGLDAVGLGRLSVGGVGDVTLIDPGMRWTLTRETLRGRSWNTPFLGRTLTGRAVMTIVGGRIVYELSGAR
jgi:dihydroorotase